MSHWYVCVCMACVYSYVMTVPDYVLSHRNMPLILPTGSTPIPQVQPWLIPVVVICACVLVLVCVTIIIVGVVMRLKRHAGKRGNT